MKPKVIKHLSNIEIDEISLVDRAANQHSTIAIAKRAPEEEMMPELYTEDGYLLDENELEDGQIVFDEEGNAYQFNEDAEEESGDNYEDDDEGVGKRLRGVPIQFNPAAKGGVDFTAQGNLASRARKQVSAFTTSARGAHKARVAGGKYDVSRRGYPKSSQQGRAARAGAMAGYNAETAGLYGTGAAVTAAGGYGLKQAHDRRYVRKNFSEEVLEELSKAYSDEERDAVLSKALGYVEELMEENAEAAEIAKSERDLRLTNEYIAKAAEYNVPIAPEQLGPVLYRMAESMDFDDCMVIHKALEAAGASLYEEYGYVGGGDNHDVLDQVNAAAQEYVGKSAASPEQAWEQVFESNPAAYDEYLAQRRGF